MTTMDYAFFLVLWLNFVVTYRTNAEMQTVFYDDQQDVDGIIVKLKQGGTTEDIQNICNKHSRFKLDMQFNLRGETYFKLVLNNDNLLRGDVSEKLKPLSDDDDDALSIKHDPKVDTVVNDNKYQIVTRAVSMASDPELDHAWYTTNQPDVKVSMNIDKAWREGYSGKNVVVAVVDTQIQTDHEDLDNMVRYRKLHKSFYSNQQLNDNFLFHGTAVSGIIAATKSNNICTTGVAYNATLQAVGLVSPSSSGLTTTKIVMALTHNLHTVDIYIAALGESTKLGLNNQNGLINQAIEFGASTGRQGKGSIYVFGAGNDGPEANAALDLFGSSIYTIFISSVEYCSVASYGQIGSNIMAVGYGGTYEHKLIKFIYPTNKCSTRSGIKGVGGTSFSAPQVTGIIALALEANPDLTWRDVQHIVVRSSKRYHFKDRYYPGYKWRRNAAGLHFHPKMGFGLIDALKMVDLAKRWNLVPNMKNCTLVPQTIERTARNGHYLIGILKVRVSDCSIRYIENILVTTDVVYSKFRGFTEIDLISPRGTISPLLTKRPSDNSGTRTPGKIVQSFRTVHFWGENASGEWKLRTRSQNNDVQVGPVSWEVTFYGTSSNPRKYF